MLTVQSFYGNRRSSKGIFRDVFRNMKSLHCDLRAVPSSPTADNTKT